MVWRSCWLALAAALVAGAAHSGPAGAVARVGDRAISARELEVACNESLNARYFHRDLPPDKRLALERERLERLIRRELDILGGLDAGLELPLDEARRQRAMIELQLGKNEYESSIGLHGWSRRDHERVLAESLLGMEARRRFVEAPAAVSDAEVRASYEAGRAEWREGEAVHVMHILLAVPKSATANAWERRGAEAAVLVDRLRAGEEFALLAGESSDDDYRIKGGDLGWVHRGRLVEPLETAVWGAADGALVGPLRGPDGIHLARVVERRDARAMPFDEAAPMVRRLLEQQRRAAAEERWYTGLRRRHPVIVLEARLLPGA